MNWLAQLATPFNLPAPALPPPKRLIAAVNRIMERWPDTVTKPIEKDRDQIVAEMAERLRNDRWEEATVAFANRAARALFETERCDRPELAALCRFYCDEVKATSIPSFRQTVFKTYLASYQPGGMHTRNLATALSAVRDSLGSEAVNLVRNIPAVLDPDGAPQAISEGMAASDDAWKHVCSLGVKDPHMPGLMHHVHSDYLRRLAPEVAAEDRCRQLFGWIKPVGRQALQADAAAVISAVLEPWRTTKPPEQQQRAIVRFLRDAYGDPRFPGNAGWLDVSDELRRVFLRWISGEDIRFLVEVISAVETSHMFEEREIFWLGLHEQGVIDEAWVAFSDEAHRHAERSRPANNSNGLRYGRQTVNGSRTNTSLLIMKIRGKTIVEGSHSYKVHVFQEDEPAPKLYQPLYDCEAIRLLSENRSDPLSKRNNSATVRSRSHTRGWQDWVWGQMLL